MVYLYGYIFLVFLIEIIFVKYRCFVQFLIFFFWFRKFWYLEFFGSCQILYVVNDLIFFIFYKYKGFIVEYFGYYCYCIYLVGVNRYLFFVLLNKN